MANWSEAIKLLLQWKGVSASDVSNACSISNATISKIINQNVKPSITTIHKLSNFFNLPIKDFHPDGIITLVNGNDPDNLYKKIFELESQVSKLNNMVNSLIKNNVNFNQQTINKLDSIYNELKDNEIEGSISEKINFIHSYIYEGIAKNELNKLKDKLNKKSLKK